MGRGFGSEEVIFRSSFDSYSEMILSPSSTAWMRLSISALPFLYFRAAMSSTRQALTNLKYLLSGCTKPMSGCQPCFREVAAIDVRAYVCQKSFLGQEVNRITSGMQMDILFVRVFFLRCGIASDVRNV